MNQLYSIDYDALLAGSENAPLEAVRSFLAEELPYYWRDAYQAAVCDALPEFAAPPPESRGNDRQASPIR